MEKAPFFDDAAGGPAGGAAHWLCSDDGVRIRVGHWTHDGAKGTALFFPGRNECVEKYGYAAGEMRKRGFAAIAVDWRGQGLADRLLADPALGHVEEFSDYQRDVAAVVAHVRALGLPEPYHVVGHSMGGCIALRALHNGLPVASTAFTAPMWGISMPSYLRPFAWGQTGLSRMLGIGRRIAHSQSPAPYIKSTTLEENVLTTDPEMFAYLVDQVDSHPELVIGGPTTHWIGEALRETRHLSRLPSPGYPSITFLGTEESTVDPARIKDRMARWPNGRLVILQDARHEVMIETPLIRDKLFDELSLHFERHNSPA